LIFKEIFRLTYEMLLEFGAHSDRESDTLVTSEYVNSLDNDKDAPFIRLLGDCRHMLFQGSLETDAGLSGEIHHILRQKIVGSVETQEGLCERYHEHRGPEAC
jgi:hypothetical protein